MPGRRVRPPRPRSEERRRASLLRRLWRPFFPYGGLFLPDCGFGRQRGCTGRGDVHGSRVAKFVTNDAPSSIGRRVESARLEAHGPESASSGDDQGQACDFAVQDDAGIERQFQRRRERRLWSFWWFRASSDPFRIGAGRPDSYKHRTSSMTPTSTKIGARLSTMRHRAPTFDIGNDQEIQRLPGG